MAATSDPTGRSNPNASQPVSQTENTLHNTLHEQNTPSSIGGGDATLVEQFAQKWQDMHEGGRSATIEDVCGSRPDLAPAVRDWLSKVGRLEAVLATQAPSGTTVQASWSSGDNVLSPPQAPDELGRLGNYRVLKLIGQGGMGKVYLAEDIQLKRRVALKILLKGGDQRFLREAQTLAAVEHDHIVTVYQIGTERETQFMAMQYLQGETLEKRLKTQMRLPLDESIRIARQIAQGLWAAHQLGITHRDIKPANIWLEAGSDRVKILDFGLARNADAAEMLTQEGAVVGTPAFMAPEQAAGNKVDHRVDLFSLGCVLYQMVSGVSPFARKDVLSTLRALELETPEEPAVKCPETAGPLSDLSMKLLAKRPDDRPQTAKEVIDVLNGVEKAMTSTTREISTSEFAKGMAPGGQKRKKSLAGPLMVGGLALVAAVFAAFVFLPPKPDNGNKDDKNIVAVNPKGNSGDPGKVVPPKDPVDAPSPVAVLPPLSTIPEFNRIDFKIKVHVPQAVKDAKGVLHVPAGTRFRFDIEVEEDTYVGIWHETDDGQQRQLYPNDHDTNHRLTKGQIHSIPRNESYWWEGSESTKLEALHFRANSRPIKWESGQADKDGFRTFRDTKELTEHLRGILMVSNKAPERMSYLSLPFWIDGKK